MPGFYSSTLARKGRLKHPGMAEAHCDSAQDSRSTSSSNARRDRSWDSVRPPARRTSITLAKAKQSLAVVCCFVFSGRYGKGPGYDLVGFS